MPSIASQIQQALLSRNQSSEKQTSGQKPTGYETMTIPYSGTNTLNNKNKKELLELIQGWSYACVSSIADEVASIEIKLFELDGKNNKKEVFNHDVLDLLYKVNDHTTKFDHFWLTQSYLEGVGEAPWFLERDQNGNVVNIYFLQPARLTPVPGENEIIKEYKYKLDYNETITLNREEVIFLKYPDPEMPIKGQGTLQAALDTVQVDRFAEKWNKRFYENSARPDSILTIDNDQAGPETKEKLKKQLRENYQGLDKSHKLMVLFGDMDLQEFGNSHKEMDFLEQQRFSRDKILGIFRVPKAILAQTEDANFASSKTAERIFARWTIRPKIERLVQQLNEFLLPMFDGTENMFLDYVDPVPENQEEKLERYQSGLQNGWLTINEVRKEEGLREIEEGDTVLLPTNLQPFTGPKDADDTEDSDDPDDEPNDSNNSVSQSARFKQVHARSKNYFLIEEYQEKVEDVARKAVKEKIKKKQNLERLKNKDNKQKQEKSVQVAQRWDDEKKEEFARAKIEIFRKFTEETEEIALDLLEQQKEEYIEILNEQTGEKQAEDINPEEVELEEEEQSEVFLTALGATLLDVYREGAERTSDFVGEPVPFDVDESQRVQDFLEENVDRVARSVTQYSNEKARDVIESGLSEGLDEEQIKNNLRDKFDDLSENRARRISRTEVSRYNSAATQHFYEQTEAIVGKEWVVNPITVCEFCKKLEGEIVAVEEKYFEQGTKIIGVEGGEMTLDYNSISYPPLHPECNCELAPITINN